MEAGTEEMIIKKLQGKLEAQDHIVEKVVGELLAEQHRRSRRLGIIFILIAFNLGYFMGWITWG